MLASDLQAIRSLKTYGEARRFSGQVLELPGLSDEDEDEDERPPDDAMYDLAAMSEVDDGDWLPRAAGLALDYLPEELDDIGEQRERFPSSPYLYINPASEHELKAKCDERGFVLRRDDDLIGLLP